MIDFDWYYYIATVQLGMSEDEFWRSTPRKVTALWDLHMDFKGISKAGNKDSNEDNKVSFIDEIPFL